jgi:diaminopimelate epimerase
MCGNGGRCMVKFAYHSGIVETTYKFLATDGNMRQKLIPMELLA